MSKIVKYSIKLLFSCSEAKFVLKDIRYEQEPRGNSKGAALRGEAAYPELMKKKGSENQAISDPCVREARLNQKDLRMFRFFVSHHRIPRTVPHLPGWLLI